jgi:hypothetical protein
MPIKANSRQFVSFDQDYYAAVVCKVDWLDILARLKAGPHAFPLLSSNGVIGFP